jgi:hypothetical protein
MTMARAHQVDTPRLTASDLVAGESESDSGARFGGGIVPAVQHQGGPGGAHSASELAYTQVAAVTEEEDENVKELKAKVKGLVTSKFGGDYKKGFAHYDGNADGGLDKDELKNLLSDAGVGNGLTRGAWASGIIKKLDKNGDKMVQWTEFDAVFSAEGGAVQRA